jgi:hypothetical protein
MLAARVCAFIAAVAVGAGCIDHRVGAGVLRNMMQPSRDPDPTVDFTREQVENPWAEPSRPASPQPQPRSSGRVIGLLTGRTAATIAAALAGAMPALVWSGTFDEDQWFARPAPQRPRSGLDGPGDEPGATRASPPP